MNTLDLREGDLILLPRRGAMSSRQVLLVSCTEAVYFDPAEMQDMPMLDPYTGAPMYKVSFLAGAQIGEATLLAKQISLISRVSSDPTD